MCFLATFNIILAKTFDCKEIPCSVIENQSWMYAAEQQTCDMKKIEMNEEDFTISPQTNETIGALNICWINKKAYFLPLKTHENFPELIVYRAQDCSITTIEKKHLEKLSKLKTLWLGGNNIEVLPPDVLDDLNALEYLQLSK